MGKVNTQHWVGWADVWADSRALQGTVAYFGAGSTPPGNYCKWVEFQSPILKKNLHCKVNYTGFIVLLAELHEGPGALSGGSGYTWWSSHSKEVLWEDGRFVRHCNTKTWRSQWHRNTKVGTVVATRYSNCMVVSSLRDLKCRGITVFVWHDVTVLVVSKSAYVSAVANLWLMPLNFYQDFVKCSHHLINRVQVVILLVLILKIPCLA